MQQQRPRSGIIFGLLSLGLLVGVAMTASPTQAATGIGPYYAEPAWDLKIPATTRFVVLTDWFSQAVLDKETGLVWERSPAYFANGISWPGSRDTCINKAVGGRKGWRLPAFAELASLIDPTVAFPGPTLPAGHPFTIPVYASYWSATTDIYYSPAAWWVDFANGIVNSADKLANLQVWCVRGGMSAEAY